MKDLILLRGLPGSGKSTLAELFAPGNGDMFISADMFFEDSEGNYNFNPKWIQVAHAWCQGEVHDKMRVTQGSDVDFRIAVANTFTQDWEMQPYLDLAEKYGWRVHTVVVENRHSSESIHNVPEATIEKMRRRFHVSL